MTEYPLTLPAHAIRFLERVLRDERARMIEASQGFGFGHDLQVDAAFDSLNTIECALPDLVGTEFCPHCDGTGDVHDLDGEWLGVCVHPPRDSDRNPEGEKPQALSAEHESAGLKGIAKPLADIPESKANTPGERG